MIKLTQGFHFHLTSPFCALNYFFDFEAILSNGSESNDRSLKVLFAAAMKNAL